MRARIERQRMLVVAVSIIVSLAAIPPTAWPSPPKPGVAVVTSATVEAYAQALQGIREQLPAVLVLETRDEARLRGELTNQQVTVAIALGIDAAEALERLASPELPIIRSVVLEADVERGATTPSRFKTSVAVDLPPAVLVREVGRLFPDRRRLGVIRGPMQSGAYINAMEKAARECGITLSVMACQAPKDVVEVFLKLKSGADLVWCPPNAQLYNSATLKPLLMASLTNRLPIIGFSEQFVQAGALFGGAADYVEIGRQTAGLALRVARGEAVPLKQEARKFSFAYNQRVARLLGVKSDAVDRPGSGLHIIR